MREFGKCRLFDKCRSDQPSEQTGGVDVKIIILKIFHAN